ncbi:MAG: FKBP-type peptidyl-prolyl cis-trans isomerase [Anaerolineales bacterium]|nr:FKBP-type peptidyl-prolyl cis-trans isomerase [Chloroflexota bacterium]MBL6981757.1 FKBP-type peptidyl-prolyl cis-trans isomerase [Anaerolineales bacterium]
MNQSKKRYGWLLIVIILTLTVTACQTAGSDSDETATELEAYIESENASDGSTEEITIEEPVAEVEPTPVEPITLEGATITESGLQYLEIEAGEGDLPKEEDIVLMNVIGSLPDGTEVVNTYQQGQPAMAIMGRGQLLPGWEEAVMLMKAGGSAKLVLPPELAFGEAGYGVIPPNSQIVMDIEIVSIDSPPTPTDVAADELTSTESGLQYIDLAGGEGVEAEAGNTVITHYTIWVQAESENSFVFSSIFSQPLTFIIGSGNIVFPGWDEGVTGMKLGGKRLLVIPPDLALGESGSGDIPPNATLVMEVELVELFIPPKMSEVNEEDYISTESGLKYYDFVEGDGATPEAGQTVVVHYSGWLEDGSMFDSSLERGQPFPFVLGQGSVIAGWDEGLSTMKVGGKRQLVIPPELGYGENGAGGVIPPNATLIFEVELLEIQE